MFLKYFDFDIYFTSILYIRGTYKYLAFIEILNSLVQGFPNFFTNGPFKEIKKVMAPFNKITHKWP